MTPIPSYRKQRAERKRLRFSAMGKASQRVQSERRMVDLPERIREQAEWDVVLEQIHKANGICS